MIENYFTPEELQALKSQPWPFGEKSLEEPARKLAEQFDADILATLSKGEV